MDNTQNSDDDDEFLTITSPYRPFPLGAKKALRADVDAVQFDSTDPRLARVSERPSEDILESWELTVIRNDDPIEHWVTDSGDDIHIYNDRVEQNGIEKSITVAEAQTAVREQNHFTRVE